MKTQNRTYLRAIAIVATLFLALVSLTFLLARHDAIEDLRKESKAKLDYFGAAMFAPTDKYTYLPGLVAGYGSITDALLSPSDAPKIREANALLHDLTTQTGASAIYVMDALGTTIAASNAGTEGSFMSKNFSSRPYFRDAMRFGSGKFYGVGTASGLPGYYIAHAVKRELEVVGVVVVKIDLLDLNIGADKGKFEMGVTDRTGVIFLSTKPEWNYRPIAPLEESVVDQLKTTRQYANLLRPTLTLDVTKEISTNEQVVTIPDNPDDENSTFRSYLMTEAPLKGSDWKAYTLMPTNGVIRQASIAAAAAAVVFGLLGLFVLNLYQRRHRMKDRERSRAELEKAHALLEQKHIELQVVNEELHRASITDPLTGAYNRRFFVEASTKLVHMANRQPVPLSIIMVDVDHFKRINDQYGHAAGDKVLVALADIYRSEMRTSDVFARMGGEEFAVALHNADAAAAYQVADRLREKIMARPIDIDGHSIFITVSCGVSQRWALESTLEPATERADKALYVAKKSGRNRVVLGDASLPGHSHSAEASNDVPVAA